MTFLQSFWSKIGHFSIFLFQAIQARKMCFTILQNEKTPFQAIKTRSSNSRKTKIFNFFLFLSNIGNKNVLYDILKGKKAFLGYNETFRTLKKGDFSKRVSQRFWSKIGHFSNILFQAIEARKKCLTMLWNKKSFCRL